MGLFDFKTPELNLAERSAKHREQYGIKTSRQISSEIEATRRHGEAALYVPPEPKKPEAPYVPIKYSPVSAKLQSYSPEQIAEYAEVAAAVGVAPYDLVVEEFKTYLRGKDFPVYDLSTVVSFMDAKSKAEGQGWGWNWLPLREKDRIQAHFGTEATRRERSFRSFSTDPVWEGEDRPASDHYTPARHIGGSHVAMTQIYDKVVPLHALKKVALIEKEFRHPVAFMVSDYAPAPAFKADPFLMVVIQNNSLRTGEGRFVIDVWDEPGFGIEHMLKSGL